MAKSLPDLLEEYAKDFCKVCGAKVHWVDCPTGGWWAHFIHPKNDHDAYTRAAYETAHDCSLCAPYVNPDSDFEPDPHGDPDTHWH